MRSSEFDPNNFIFDWDERVCATCKHYAGGLPKKEGIYVYRYGSDFSSYDCNKTVRGERKKPNETCGDWNQRSNWEL